MVIVFTGDGKGKTTASLGQMVRIVGQDRRALMLQFIKGPWIAGEDKFAKKFGAFEIVKGGKGFVGIQGDTLPFEEHKEAAEKTLARAKEEIQSQRWDLVVLDEVNVAVDLKLIKAKDVLDILKDLPMHKFVILSGRSAPKSFIDRADLATEMREIKHPYADGELALKGVEF
jgi:cob(I)alamin adenosyltransferase